MQAKGVVMPSAPQDLAYANALLDRHVIICVLGQFRLVKNQIPLSLQQGAKSAELLGLLAVHAARGIARETLLETLWPQSGPHLAGQSLNNLIYSLHKLLGASLGGAMPVCRSDGLYRLNLEAGLGVDLVSFDTLADRGDRAAALHDMRAAAQSYAQAADLYQGDLCVGSDIYALVERERLRARYLTLLAHLAEYEFGKGDYPACLGRMECLVRHDPYREDAHRLIMRCYMRQGMRAQALRQYALCERLLKSEFDAPPEPETGELYDRIRLDPKSV